MNKTAPVIHVVDDDEAMRDSMTELEGEGYAVATYPSAPAFLCRSPRRHARLSGPRRAHAGHERAGTPGTPGRARVHAAHRLHHRSWRRSHGRGRPAPWRLRLRRKPFNDADLLGRIRRALELDAELASRRSRDTALNHRLEQLTPREAGSPAPGGAGRLNKQIADELDISMKTVEAHRARVMEKMGVRTWLTWSRPSSPWSRAGTLTRGLTSPKSLL